MRREALHSDLSWCVVNYIHHFRDGSEFFSWLSLRSFSLVTRFLCINGKVWFPIHHIYFSFLEEPFKSCSARLGLARIHGCQEGGHSLSGIINVGANYTAWSPLEPSRDITIWILYNFSVIISVYSSGTVKYRVVVKSSKWFTLVANADQNLNICKIRPQSLHFEQLLW